MSTRTDALVWDLPVRLLHWLTAGAFAVAAAVAMLGDDDGPLFPLHALAGVMLVAIVAARVLWALLGSPTARLASFEMRPSALAAYIRSAGRHAPSPRKAHNPATSWFAPLALIVVLGLGITGYLLGRGNEGLKDVHQVFAYALLGLVGIHVAGVLAHVVRTRENLVAGMITGRLDRTTGVTTIRSAHRPAAAVFAILAVACGAAVWSGYDPARRTLDVGVGAPLVLGEVEKGREATGAATADDDE